VRTYGEIKRGQRHWLIKCEPHVMMRLKRFFKKIDQHRHGSVLLSDTLENCRELAWFLERYPMVVDDPAYLERRAREFMDQSERTADLLAGKYTPREFAMAIPPRAYQSVAAEMALQSGSLLLADDLGLGKTASAIAMITQPAARPALVVTLTHLPRQWKHEIERFAPGLRVHIVKKGKPYPLIENLRARHQQQALPFNREDELPDVVVMNYHKLAGWADVLAGLVRSVTFDEIQELRHPGTAKWNGAKHIADAADLKLGLSATPIYNYGSEIHSVYEVLKPSALGSFDEFVREWCTGTFGMDQDKASIADPKAFGAYLRESGLMLRRTRSEVGRELPPLSRIVHHVESDPAALERIESSAAELARIILTQGGQKRGEKMRAAEELSWLLRQATSIAKAPYVAEFVRLLVESGERVVLYGWHREVYSIWQDRLSALNPVLYTGTESPTQKAAAVQRFVSGESKVLIMSLRSGAGLDGLQGCARNVVFGELDYSPGVHEQCIGRVHRDGQGDPCAAFFLVADSGCDPLIADVLGLKLQQIEGLRNPTGAPVEALAGSAVDIKALAAAYLKQRGMQSPVAAEATAS